MNDHLWQLVALIAVSLAVSLTFMWVNIKCPRSPVGRFMTFVGMLAALAVCGVAFVKFAVEVL